MNLNKHPLLKFALGLWLVFWRWATPFWLFRDASHGTTEQRIANYRYNRSQREILHAYTLKWMIIAVCMLLMIEVYSHMLKQLIEGSPAYICVVLACASSGIGFSVACVVIAILLICYLFLTHIKR